MDKFIDGEEKQFFDIPFAGDLMRKPRAKVLQQCAAFNARLLTERELNQELPISGANSSRGEESYDERRF